MTHDDFLPGPVDPNRIELIEDHELRFWTREFGCSAEHLLDAIEAVGVGANAVGEYLVMRQYAGAAILSVQMGSGAHLDHAIPPDRSPS